MEQQTPRSQGNRPGLLSGMADLSKNFFGLILTRIQLAALELAEIRNNVLKLAVFFALGVIISLFAIGYWTVLIAYLAWEALGWKILLIIAGACTAAAVGIFLYILSLIKMGKLSMPATMAELSNDHDALK